MNDGIYSDGIRICVWWGRMEISSYLQSRNLPETSYESISIEHKPIDCSKDRGTLISKETFFSKYDGRENKMGIAHL